MRNRPRKDEAKASDYRARRALKMVALCMKAARRQGTETEYERERTSYWVAMARSYNRTARMHRSSARRERAHQQWLKRHPDAARHLARYL